MPWIALCGNNDGTTYTAAFGMKRVNEEQYRRYCESERMLSTIIRFFAHMSCLHFRHTCLQSLLYEHVTEDESALEFTALVYILSLE